jgi:hypothetical protein
VFLKIDLTYLSGRFRNMFPIRNPIASSSKLTDDTAILTRLQKFFDKKTTVFSDKDLDPDAITTPSSPSKRTDIQEVLEINLKINNPIK